MKKNGWVLLLLICGLFSGCSSSDHELYLYTWGGYIKPGLIERFEKENGCSIIIDTFDSNEAMYAKLKAGASGYDLVFPSNYIVEMMIDQGMLQPINVSKVPNKKNLDPDYLKFAGPSIQNFGFPYMVSYSGVGYRKDKVKDIQQEWSIFGRTDLKGRMTMLNDNRETIGAALKQLGYSINTIDQSEIDQAVQLLLQWKKNLAKFESEQYKNGIANAEYLVVHGYNGDILQVMDDNPNVGFYLPKEGSAISIDYAVIPKNAGNVKLAEKFINYLLEPEVAAENTAYTFFLCPNIQAYEQLSDELKNNPSLFPPKDIRQKSEVIKNLGKDADKYHKAWDIIKSAG